MYHKKRKPCTNAVGICIAVTFYCFLCCHLLAQAQPSAATVLFVGDLNRDSYADTVIGGVYGGAFTRLPERVIWGKDPVHPQPPNGPLVTIFKYPAYSGLAGSVSFLQLNPGDTVTDMLFFLWWKNNVATAEPDTGRGLAVFGQTALSTVPVIDFNQIPSGFQTHPFFAQEVQSGIHLTEPKVRDLSDVESYVLAPFRIEEPLPIVTDVEYRTREEVHIYPNPSLYTITIKAALPAGQYTARVTGVNGQMFEEQSIEVESNGTLWHNIDVSRLASGYYVVQLLREGTPIGSYPFLIER